MNQTDGFKIDQINVYESLGKEKIIQLSTAFYNRVYTDDDEEHFKTFRVSFQGIPKEQAIQNQYEFFIQRLGGPQLYSQRKGHPALRGRHHKFAITSKSAERWLYHMNLALDDVGINKGTPEREALDEFFNHTAYFLINREEPNQQE